MTGPEHYLEAEHLLNKAHRAGREGHFDESEMLSGLARAHAALALVAATYDVHPGAIAGFSRPAPQQPQPDQAATGGDGGDA